MADFKDFQPTIKKIIRDAQTRIYQHVADTAVAIATEVTQRTPVDTSRALSNWQISQDETVPYLLPNVDGDMGSTRSQSITGTLAHAQRAASRFVDVAVRSSRGTAILNIVNNAPYIQRLNEGYSRQARSGWIERGARRAFTRAQRSRRPFFRRA